MKILPEEFENLKNNYDKDVEKLNSLEPAVKEITSNLSKFRNNYKKIRSDLVDLIIERLDEREQESKHKKLTSYQPDEEQNTQAVKDSQVKVQRFDLPENTHPDHTDFASEEPPSNSSDLLELGQSPSDNNENIVGQSDPVVKNANEEMIFSSVLEDANSTISITRPSDVEARNLSGENVSIKGESAEIPKSKSALFEAECKNIELRLSSMKKFFDELFVILEKNNSPKVDNEKYKKYKKQWEEEDEKYKNWLEKNNPDDNEIRTNSAANLRFLQKNLIRDINDQCGELIIKENVLLTAFNNLLKTVNLTSAKPHKEPLDFVCHESVGEVSSGNDKGSPMIAEPLSLIIYDENNQVINKAKVKVNYE